MKKAAYWIRTNIVIITSLLICSWMLFVMIHYSGKSLWGDSIGTISIASPNHSLWETLKIDVTEDVFVAPLFYLVANIWLKIAPYGTVWVKLICELFICIGIIIASQAAKNMYSDSAGIFTSLFLSICPYSVTQGAYEFRHYALWFMLTALLIWFYDRKMKKPTPQNLIGYGMTAILCCYTHFNGVFVFFILFLWDVSLWMKKRITIRHISSYLLWGVLFFPYLVYAYFYATELTKGFWPNPNFEDLFKIDLQILIEPLLCGIFYISALWAVWRIFTKDNNNNNIGFLIWLILGYKAINFIYSNLNQGYSMWIPRYFFCQLPAMMILCAVFISEILKKAFHKGKLQSAAFCTLICVVFGFLEILFIRDLREHRYPEIIHQPFEQTAEILRQQDDFWNPETAFYYSAYNIEAWQYYLAHGDMTPGLLHLLPMDLRDVDLSPYRVIYVCELQNPISEESLKLLQDSYEFEELHHDYKLYRLERKTSF